MRKRILAMRLSVAVVLCLALLLSPVSGLTLDSVPDAEDAQQSADTAQAGEENAASACGHVHDETCGYVRALDEQPCTHVHDEACGYIEPAEGRACSHEHGEDCFTSVCAHIHDESCYAESCPHVHSADCYSDGEEPAEGGEKQADACPHEHDGSCFAIECAHVHGEECLSLSCPHVHDADCGYVGPSDGQPCSHEHDADCGYAEAVEGRPCVHVCPLCAGDAAYTVTAWEWADEDGQLEWNGDVSMWSLGLPGACEENPVTADVLTQLLPGAVTALLADGSETVLDISWELSDFPEEIFQGRWVLTAAVPEGYSLAGNVPELHVMLELGGAETYADKAYPGVRRPLTDDDSFSDHIVRGIQPEGVTVNLFNYSTQMYNNGDVNDDLLPKTNNVAVPSTWNMGINHGRLLLFGDSMVGAGYWNLGSGAGRPWGKAHTNMKGIVEPVLGGDGYPRINLANARRPLPDATGTPSSGVTDVAFLHWAENYTGAGTAGDVNAARALSPGVLANAGFTANADGTVTGGGDTSLSYLFDLTPLGAGDKTVHENVTGLFQLDDEGYYYYYARQNFAELNTANGANSFILYDGPAVWRTDGGYNSATGKFDGDMSLGNFFPFNTADEVFDCIQVQDSAGRPTNILSSSESVENNGNAVRADHHMGMTVQVDFRQPENGTINNGSSAPIPMTFQFSGDDDVWVFIDDVLVLDIGGIHSELYGTIDFSTGDVYIGQSWRTGGVIPGDRGKTDVTGDQYNMAVDYTTLRELFENVQGEDFNEAGWNGGTFASNTNHTLKMFYLERGNYDSSLALRFNLQPRLYQEIKKVDQNGNPIQGVEFTLYAAEKNGGGYELTSGALATLTTGSDGIARFMEYDENGEPQPFNFIDRYTSGGTEYYILEESKTPPGYRTLPENIVLRFDNSNTMLVVVNRWTTGAYASFTSHITGNSKVAYGRFNEDGTISQKTDESGNVFPVSDGMKKNGLVVAVPMLYQQNMSRPENAAPGGGLWVALYGSNTDGYNTVIPAGRDAEDWRKAVLEAVLRQCAGLSDTPSWYLSWDSENHRLAGELQDLPGRADRYERAGETDGKDMKMVYAVIDPNVFDTLNIDRTADAGTKYEALGNYVRQSGRSMEEIVNEIYAVTTAEPGASGQGITLLNVDQFLREFRSLIYIPNEQRELRVWKVDENGEGVNGAEFTLYNRNDGSAAASGVTAEVDGMDGVLIFRPLSEAAPAGYANMEWASSANTEYYLKETSAPGGYKLNPTEIPIVVGIYSIYADAGTQDDGVTVMAGVGKLAQTMVKYAADTNVNITLRDITAIAQVQPGGSFDLRGWTDMTLADTGGLVRSLNLHYGINNMIDYGLHDEDGGRNYYPFFVTDTGFIRARVRQNGLTLDTPAYEADKGSSTNRDILADTDITSLFTLLNTVVVTDKQDETPDTGALAISKTVTGEGVSDADYTRYFRFKLELKDPAGSELSGSYYFYGTDKSGYVKSGDELPLHHDEEIVILGLPAGTAYTVTETDAGADGFHCLPAGGAISGSVVSRTTARAGFVNYRGEPRTGSLSVSKTVAGSAGDRTKSFTFTVTLSDRLSGQYGDMSFTDGVAEFKLRHGESASAENLPAGIGYTVTESGSGDYDVSKSGDTGTILSGETFEAVFVNTKELPPEPEKGHLTVSKTVTGSRGDRTKSFTFTVTLSDRLSGQYGDMSFTEGVAEFKLRHGESATAENLPAGIDYTVTESGSRGYTVSKNGDSGTIEEGETAKAEFVNHRAGSNEPDNGYTSVTVKKVWVLDDGGKRPESVTAVLYRDAEKYASIELSDKNGWSHTWSSLNDSYTWTVDEPDVPEGFTSTVSGSGGTVFTITNDDIPVRPTAPVEPTEPQKPVEPEQPVSPERPVDPEHLGDPDIPLAGVDPDPTVPDIPQTGTNWRPVWLLAAAGCLALLAGIWEKRRYHGKHEA